MTRRRSDGSGTGKDEPGDLTDMERALLAEGRRRITVRDGDEAREMSMNEIVTRKTAETAIKGSPHAQRTWFQVHAAAEAREAAIREKGAEFWRMYQRYWRKQIAEAEAKGEVPPDPIPHPDDVCIDHRNEVTIDGPVTREEARVYARIANEREAYLRQHVLDQRLRRNETLLEPERGFGSALPMAFLSNSVLPQRLRLDDAGMSRLHSRFRLQTIRELKKDAYRASKQLGYRTRRESVSPELDMLVRMLPAIADIAAELAASQGTDRDVDRAVARTVATATSVVKAS